MSANTSIATSEDCDEFKHKSWAELCEEEDSNDTVKNVSIKEEKIEEDEGADPGANIKIKEEKTDKDERADADVNIKIKEEKIDEEDADINFRTYASLFNKSNGNQDIKDTTTPIKIKSESKTPLKNHTTLSHQDDLSLTSHLDTFHMASPLKVKSNLDSIMDEDTKVSPFKNKRRHNGGGGGQFEESPSKVTRNEDRRHTRSERRHQHEQQHTPYAKFKSDGSRKRQRDDNIESPGTPGSGKKLALETDSAVLLRRQKQIDFGKNTVGYDRYCSMVPRESRTKDHPKTPPKELQYSRRAWDGLIKSWRSRLHFWDPPNENGEVNSLELDEDEDFSSIDTQSVDSLPCTPIQEWKRRVRAKRDSTQSDDEEDCKPLQE